MRVTPMSALIERADAYMRHCVAGVTGAGKDKGAAFAICKAGGNRAGYYKAGTKQVTAKGRRAMRSHAQDAARTGKDAAYEKAIKEGTDTMTMRDLIEAIEQRVEAEGDLAEMGPPPGPGYKMVFGRWVKATENKVVSFGDKKRIMVKKLGPNALRKKAEGQMHYQAKLRKRREAQGQE